MRLQSVWDGAGKNTQEPLGTMQPDETTQRWRRLAAEAHAEAQRMSDAESRASMLHIARTYERLAQRAERYARKLADLVRAPQPLSKKD
jgi:hypothetical protein